VASNAAQNDGASISPEYQPDPGIKPAGHKISGPPSYSALRVGIKASCAPLEAYMTQLIHFGALKQALGLETNRALKALLARHDIPVVMLSRQSKAVTTENYSALLSRMSERKAA
jgi:hypothetical protein